MDVKLRIFLIFLLFLGMIMIFKMIKGKKLAMKYGMYLTIVLILLLILVIFPNIIENIATWLGFKEAPNMLFLLAIFLLFYMVFRLYTNISKLQEMNKTLIQELSILKNELKKK